MVKDPKQGEVWLADMGLAGKRRPVVVMLSDGVPVERALIIQVPTPGADLTRLGPRSSQAEVSGSRKRRFANGRADAANTASC
jgi:mRNA-degrading endonuclease toxin of MazEF toxin-antitoxin module